MYWLLLVISIFIAGCQNDSEPGLYTVSENEFLATTRTTGELQARRTRQITCPDFKFSYGKAKLVDLIPQGTQVKAGDYIAQLDTSSIARRLQKTRADLAIAERDYNQLVIKQEQELKALQSQLASAEASLQLAAMDTVSVQFEPPASRTRSRLQFRMSSLGIGQLRRKLSATQQVQIIDRFIARQKIESLRREVANARASIRVFTLHAPVDGMLQYSNRGRDRGRTKIGDEYWPGEKIVGLPDLSRMKVLTTVHETEYDNIKSGQTVQVVLDAYPQRFFTGKVVSISRTCRNKSREKRYRVFDVVILLGQSDLLLKPGMTVSCTIKTAYYNSVLTVPLNYVHISAGRTFVYLKTNNRIQPTEVRVLAKNESALAITSGIAAGTQLVPPPQKDNAHAL